MVRDTGDTPGDISGHHDDLVNALRDQVAQLQKQLEHAVERDHKNRRLLAAALERIPPQLETPPEAAERPSKPPDDHEECRISRSSSARLRPAGGVGCSGGRGSNLLAVSYVHLMCKALEENLGRVTSSAGYATPGQVLQGQ